MARARNRSRSPSGMSSARRSCTARSSDPNAMPAPCRHFRVLRSIAIEHQRATPHGLDQRRMRAAHGGGVDVGKAVRAQLAIARAVDRAGDDHAGIARVAHAGDVVPGIGGVAHQHQLEPGLHALECFAHFERVVLRLQAADVEEVAARLEREPVKRGARGQLAGLSAVGDEDGALSVALEVILLDSARHR